MSRHVWSEETKERWKFWDNFEALLEVIHSTDGPIVNPDWLNDEIMVVGQVGLSSTFLELRSSGQQYGNPNHSSLAYFLGITKDQPEQYPVGMKVDRGRNSFPDIDLDFDDRHRDKVIDYARNKYGYDRVAHIATFSTVKAKSAIRDAARVLDYPYAVGDAIANKVPPPVLGITKTLDEALETSSLKNDYHSSKDTQAVIDAAKGLEGLIRQPGIHPAGVVIAQGPVVDYVPVMRKPNKDGSDGPLVTQYDMDWIELNGLLKVDFLGLRNLGVIDMALKTEKERRDET